MGDDLDLDQNATTRLSSINRSINNIRRRVHEAIMKNVNVPLIRLLTVRLLQRVPNGVAMEPRTVASRASVALETRCYGMGSHVSDNDPEASAAATFKGFAPLVILGSSCLIWQPSFGTLCCAGVGKGEKTSFGRQIKITFP